MAGHGCWDVLPVIPTPANTASRAIRNFGRAPTPTSNLNGWAAVTNSAGPAVNRTTTWVATGGPNGGAFMRTIWNTDTVVTAYGDLIFYGNPAWGVAGQINQGMFIPYPGRTYTFSVYVRSSVAVQLRIQAQWLTLNGSAGTSVGQTITLTPNVWTRLFVTGTCPDTGVGVRLDVDTTAVLTWPAGATFDVTMAMATEGSMLWPYADGDTPGWRWTGTAGASESVGYPYTLEGIVGPLLFDYTAPGTYALTPAAWDPVANGMCLLSVTDLVSMPAQNLTSSIADYGAGAGDTTPPGTFTHRYIGNTAGGVNVQTRITGGLGPSRGIAGGVVRYVLASGVLPGGRLFAANNTQNTVLLGSTGASGDVVTAMTHSWVRVYTPGASNAAYHSLTRVVGIRASDTATVMRAMAWLARTYGAAVPAGY